MYVTDKTFEHENAMLSNASRTFYCNSSSRQMNVAKALNHSVVNTKAVFLNSEISGPVNWEGCEESKFTM